ncbi:Ubiquitin carboxyl-terminal hydrolase 16 [Hordeum vulgare]|nr:Ubiquitin carboxyl-terminal hydrolase 16 [Hordeum vulgare]
MMAQSSHFLRLQDMLNLLTVRVLQLLVNRAKSRALPLLKMALTLRFRVACDPSEKADDLPESSVKSEIRVVVPDNLPTTKSLIRQQTAPTVVRHYPSESTLFPYELFVKLYNFDKVELRPFGLCNLGNRCKTYERGKKKLTISEAPNILTIALKRYQSGMFGKINKAIRFPEYLNLSSYMSATDDCSPVYRLYAVVVHRDVMDSSVSGHYVCYVKDSQGKWYEMDDSQVKRVSLKNVRSECAYMLLYARCSPRAPRSLRKLIIGQGLSHTKKARKTTDPEPTCSEGQSYFSRHQGAQSQSCRDHAVNGHTYRLVNNTLNPVLESTSTSEDSSLFSHSDAGSSGNLSSDNTDSTTNPGGSKEYAYISGSSDQMHPLSRVVSPQEHSRQMSSLNPSSSTQYADQGEVDSCSSSSIRQAKGFGMRAVRAQPSSMLTKVNIVTVAADIGAVLAVAVVVI